VVCHAAAYGRRDGCPIDGHFAVIDRATPSAAHLIDPYRGPCDDAYADLVDMWTGVVLVFEEAVRH
jgi:hypothetical protein